MGVRGKGMRMDGWMGGLMGMVALPGGIRMR